MFYLSVDLYPNITWNFAFAFHLNLKFLSIWPSFKGTSPFHCLFIKCFIEKEQGDLSTYLLVYGCSMEPACLCSGFKSKSFHHLDLSSENILGSQCLISAFIRESQVCMFKESDFSLLKLDFICSKWVSVSWWECFLLANRNDLLCCIR